MLLIAERAALLAGRDDEFTMLITIGHTGMRWGETIGLERDLLLPGLINVEWQLRGGRRPLPGLLSDIVTVDLRGRTPQQLAAMILGKLAALGIVASAPRTDMGGRVQDVKTVRPAGAVRVGEADPRRLGVHAAISVPGVPDEVLPEYVRRELRLLRSPITPSRGRGASRPGPGGRRRAPPTSIGRRGTP